MSLSKVTYELAGSESSTSTDQQPATNRYSTAYAALLPAKDAIILSASNRQIEIRGTSGANSYHSIYNYLHSHEFQL